MGTINPMGNIVEGLLRGYAIGQMLRRQAREEHEHKRRVAREEWADQQQDLRTRLLLESAGRPVEGGTVAELYEGPEIGGVKLPTIPVRRKAEGSRTARYKTRSGETIARELYTPEEQAQRQTEAAMIRQRMLGEVTRSEKQKELDTLTTELPGLGRMHPSLIGPAVALRGHEAQIKRAEAAATARVGEGVANRRSREVIAGANRHSREKLAKPLRTEVTPERHELMAQRVAVIDKELVETHSEAQRFGDTSKLAKGATFLDEKGQEQTINDLIKARYANKAREKKAQADQLTKERERLAKALGWETGAPQAPVPQSGPGRSGAKPVTVKLPNGQTVTFPDRARLEAFLQEADLKWEAPR